MPKPSPRTYREEAILALFDEDPTQDKARFAERVADYEPSMALADQPEPNRQNIMMLLLARRKG